MPTKVSIVKDMVFPVATYGCNSWSIKKAEHRRTDAFELWCWRRLLRVPWTARRWNQLILKEISPEYSLEGLMLKLKLQYSGHLIWRTDSFEKTLMLANIESGRIRGWQRMRWVGGIQPMHMSLSKFRELVMDREGWHAAVHGVTKSWTWLSDWTELLFPTPGDLPDPGIEAASLVSPALAGGFFTISATCGSDIKNWPTMLETQVQSLGHEDPLEKGMATHSSILAWKIPWTEEPGRLWSMWSHSQTWLSN